MGLGRIRWGMRHSALAAGMVALSIAALILWLGSRAEREVDRLAAEGEVTRGWTLIDSGQIGYAVGGVEYRTFLRTEEDSDSEPIFKPSPVATPRLGPPGEMQVVYLPSDPSVARLREDMSTYLAAIYGAAGLFGLIGLVFLGVGLFLLPGRRRRS